MKRPGENDYDPYYKRYISMISDSENIIENLRKQKDDSYKFLKSIPGEKAGFAYAPGKWTIKEVLGHIIDTEKVMAYRALCIARGEKKALPGFEQDDYVKEGKFNKRELSELIEEFKKVREVNLLLFNNFEDDILDKRGNANNVEITVLALLFIIAGHELHHMKILKDKYLK